MSEELMSASMADVVTRRLLPRAVVAQSRVDGLARLGAAARQRLGRRGRVDLYFAFDDPWSAVAVLDLSERLRDREVVLALRPIVRRGIPGDPAVDLKRQYALTDARRLGGRLGLALGPSEPREPESTSYLADWAAAAPQGPALTRFCVEALRRLWFAPGAAVRPSDFAELWRSELGSEPAPPGATLRVRRNERRMCLRGIYDVPAAWVHGQWFFAHERAAQIADRVDALGWAPAR
jgi:2-hydroxychromene-2-carboxylate isomerase